MMYPWSSGAILTATDLNAAIANPGLGVQTWASPVSSGFTIGNGTAGGQYQKIGREIMARAFVQLGSTSAITGEIVLTLPAQALSTYGVRGRGVAYDTAPARYDLAVYSEASDTTATVRPVNASGTYAQLGNAMSATVPFTWGTSDLFYVDLSYLAA